MKQLLLAVDLGTSLIKCAVYDTEGNCLASVTEPVKDERPAPGIFLQHGEALFQSVVRCMAETAQALGDEAQMVAAVAFTGQMAGFMGVGEHWEDITGWSCSLDTRYMPYAVAQQNTLREPFLNISGTNSPIMCAKFAWFQDAFPTEAKKIAKYVMISGYVIGRLGEVPIEKATIDGSFITWSGMADVKQKAWSQDICKAVGMDPKHLPIIVDSDQVCGQLSPKMAKKIGLQSGIPLVAGAGDKVAGCVGANILTSGDMIFEAASYGGFSCMVDDFLPDTEAHCFDIITSAKKGSFYAHKYIQASGIIQDWYVDQFIAQTSLSRAEAYRKMDEADIPPGSDGLMAIGLLGGSAIPLDNTLKGMFVGHTLSHTSAHFFRALRESLTYDLSISIDRVAATYPQYAMHTMKLIGGGAKSQMWAQMLADICQCTVQRLNRNDAALWGATILAGCGVGIFDNMKEVAGKYVAVQDEYKPNEVAVATYAKHKQVYKELIEQSHSMFTRLEQL